MGSTATAAPAAGPAAGAHDTAVSFVPISPAFPAPQAAAGAGPWTFVLPAVSVGNVGQLAVDLLLTSAPAAHIGRLHTPAVLPLAAPAPSVPTHLSPVLTPTELYAVRTPARTLIVAQQRAPLARGRAAEHARELVAWARAAGCGEVVVLGSANAAGRRDVQLRAGASPSARMRFAATRAAMDGPVGEALGRCGWGAVDGVEGGRGWTAGEAGLKGAEEDRLGGAGRMPAFLPTARRGAFLREVLEVCEEEEFPLAALLMFVHEGDNSGDARVMASAVSFLLGIEVEDGPARSAPEATEGGDCGVGGEKLSALGLDKLAVDPLAAYMTRWRAPPVWLQTVEPPRGLY